MLSVEPRAPLHAVSLNMLKSGTKVPIGCHLSNERLYPMLKFHQRVSVCKNPFWYLIGVPRFAFGRMKVGHAIYILCWLGVHEGAQTPQSALWQKWHKRGMAPRQKGRVCGHPLAVAGHFRAKKVGRGRSSWTPKFVPFVDRKGRP